MTDPSTIEKRDGSPPADDRAAGASAGFASSPAIVPHGRRASAPRSSGRPGTPITTRRRHVGQARPKAAAILVLALVVTIVPVLYLASVSVMNQADISAGYLFPRDPSWSNWSAALTESNLPRGILNSVIAALAGALLTLGCALPASWAMVRHRTGGRTLAGTILSPWLLPPIVAVVPLFMLLRIAGLNNTLLGLTVVYALANTAVAVWLLDGFVRTIPVELDEAAQLDGAGPIRVLFGVVAPLLTPGLVAVGVIVAVLNYNEFVLATFLTQGPDAQTVPVVLSLMLGERIQDFGKIAAASLTAVVPVFAAAVFLQRWLVAGLTSGSVK